MEYNQQNSTLKNSRGQIACCLQQRNFKKKSNKERKTLERHINLDMFGLYSKTDLGNVTMKKISMRQSRIFEPFLDI